ncbi:hypothetical protein FKP32DRAFT_454831 [Trametes sanguinea]|nr:hypothetical protein FKP32DRAFT_454831 [Trametes sanguinea]
MRVGSRVAIPCVLSPPPPRDEGKVGRHACMTLPPDRVARRRTRVIWAGMQMARPHPAETQSSRAEQHLPCETGPAECNDVSVCTCASGIGGPSAKNGCCCCKRFV